MYRRRVAKRTKGIWGDRGIDVPSLVAGCFAFEHKGLDAFAVVAGTLKRRYGGWAVLKAMKGVGWEWRSV